MGATPDFLRPGWNNPLDEDLDWMRDNFHFLMCRVATGLPVLPNWSTTVDVGTGADYSKPDGYVLNHADGRAIYINLVWTDKTYTDESPIRTTPVITQITVGYDDGVSSPGLVWFSPVTLTAQVAAFTTTAKHFENASPHGHYETGNQGDSPRFPAGMVVNYNGSTPYEKMTLVFCIHPNEYADGDIFASTSYNFYVSMLDTDGTFILGWRDWVNTQRSIQIAATGSPTDGSIWPKDQWTAIMIVLDSDQTTSPETKNITIWANGSEVFNGTYDGRAAWNPQCYVDSMWIGNGDAWPTVDHYLSYVWCKQEALDPATYWSSFFDGSNKPLAIGETGQLVTGTQPDTYCPDADFTNNRGFGPNWTEIGTVATAPSSPTD